MNNKILIVVVVILIALALGGYFVLGRKVQTQIPTSQNSNIPTNPSGVVNPDMESPNYKLYSKETYEAALKDRKVLLLYFTANWCPICREQEPINMQVLDSLRGDTQIIALRIHILDSETTKETEDLAKKYNVSYQHTFIIIGPSGKVAMTYTGPLTASDLKARLLDARKL